MLLLLRGDNKKITFIILVVAGAYSLNIKQTSFTVWRSWLLPFKAVFREKGSRLMMCVALLLVGGFLAVMVITHFQAIAQVEVAYFISLKRSSLLFGIVYGALLFGERAVGRHLMAGIVMVAGIVLIMTT